MNIKNYFILLFFFIVSIATAQSIEVNGIVTDSKTKQSIPGVNVTIKSSNKGVTTDFDGKYSIKLNPNEVLTFSNIGYTKQEIKVSKSQTLNISLSEESNKLEEVVINVGYGTQKKKLVTNAISTVRSEAFDDRPIINVAQAIQGNAAGVTVVQPSGKPGVGMDIKIRGISSIQSGNNPLYVIDGVQTYSSEGISTEDITDIQVLKDATATAIYGVNGSAGVVIITTKKGKLNNNVFNFSSYRGFSNVVKNIEVLNPSQYNDLMSDIGFSQMNNPLYKGIETNWSDLVIQTGEDQNIDFSFAGGKDKLKLFSSISGQSTKGIIKPAAFNRFSNRINLDYEISQKVKSHINFNYNKISLNNTNDNNSANQGGVILSALTTQSYLPVYSEQLNRYDPVTGLPYSTIYNSTTNEFLDGYQDGQFAPNPLASLENPVAFQSRQEDTKINKFLTNLSFDVTLIDNLIWKPSVSLEYSRSLYQFFVDSYRSNYGRASLTSSTDYDPTVNGIGREHVTKNKNWNIENTLNYNIKKNENEVNILVGNSIQLQRYDQLKIEGTGFTRDLRKLDISKMMYTSPFASDTIAREKNYVSFFGRATYSYKGKYILNGVFRASGASQLATSEKWGYFPGVSLAWIISNEDFLKESKIISELKLRGGWGKAGNISGIDYYSSFGLKGDDHGPLQNYVNADLTWETTTDLNIGVDLGIFNNRAKISVDLFKKETVDLFNNIKIFDIPYYYNGGKIENKGLELGINTINFKGDFNWNTNFNISFLKNKVIEMSKYGTIGNYGYENINRIEAGQPLGNFYGFIATGVNPDTGILEYKDLNGDGRITKEYDATVIGNAIPDYTFGLTNSLSFKAFSFDALITASQGNDIYNASKIELEGMTSEKNQSISVLDRWTENNRNTNIPKAGPSNYLGISPLANSTRWVEDGSYIRLKSVTLAYTFKKVLKSINSIKLYATAQNLYTITNYSGFDPEVSASGDAREKGTGIGIDYGTYPQVKTYIFGLKANF